ncbi:MAG: cupin domain-containing protein [Pirellulales bacterium]
MPYELVDFATLPGVPCPCGTARRGLTDVGDFPATLHVTAIDRAAKTHFHKRMTEVYFILSCSQDAVMELDDERLPLKPELAVLIRPETRHRVVGSARVVIVAWPKFDPADEWLPDGTPANAEYEHAVEAAGNERQA